MLLPQVELVAALVNPDNPNAEDHIKDLQAAARTFGLGFRFSRLQEIADFETAFATIASNSASAPYSSPAIRSSTPTAVELSTWPHATPFQPSTRGAISSMLAAC